MPNKNFMSFENAEEVLGAFADEINSTFVGTQAEWDAIVAGGHANDYKLVNITDDEETGGDIEKSYTIVADGTKTYRTLLNTLYTKAVQFETSGYELTRIVGVYNTASANVVNYMFDLSEPSLYAFTSVHLSTTSIQLRTLVLKASSSERRINTTSLSTGANTYDDSSSNVPSSGVKFTLYYK